MISQNREEHSADRRYAKAEHTARMTSWGLWDTTRRRREKAGEKASRMEPNISEGLVIAEGGLVGTTSAGVVLDDYLLFYRREDGSVLWD